MIVYPQKAYSDTRIKGYGCGVVSIVEQMGQVAEKHGFFYDEFTDHDMKRLLEMAFANPKIMHGNCFVRRWHLLAQCTLEVMGYKSKVTRTFFKMGHESFFRNYSDLETNAIIWQHNQIRSREPWHFLTATFNPDTSLSIEDKPCGMRGLNVKFI